MRAAWAMLAHRARAGFASSREGSVVALIVCFAVAMGGVLWNQAIIRDKAVRSAVLREAAGQIAALREFRTLYTSEVVSRVKDHGIDVRHDYAEVEGAIPLPATLSMLIGERLSADHVGGQVMLYSPYPFPWRQDEGALRDDFARAAWDQFSQDPDRPFFRYEDSAHGTTLRYAVADRMRQGSVTYHNDHPQTPKRDWKLGDVRGVLEVRVPLHIGGAGSLTALESSLGLLALLGVLGAVSVGILTSRLRSHAATLDARITNRTADLTRTVRELEMQKRALDESSIVSATDVRGNIIYVNDTFVEISGYSREELLGKNHRMLNSGEHPPAFFEELWRTVARGDTWRGEIKNKREDGTYYWVYATIVPFLKENGKPYQYVAIRFDITERKALDEQLIRAQKLESIGQLAAGIAHEINTPTQYVGDNTRFLQEAFDELLPVLVSATQAVQALDAEDTATDSLKTLKAALLEVDSEYLREEIPRAIQQSLDGIERVATIVKAMKEFSHPGVADKANIDLNQALESTAIVARNEWKYVAELEFDLEPDLPTVPCLPSEFNQVILNLIVNAAHTIADVVGDDSEEKGTITLSTRLDGEYVEVLVRDTGAGIPVSARPKIFDPFFTTKGVGRGTGQGLAIAHDVIVNKHGGTISFETQLGQGTVFTIRLPLTRQDSLAEDAAA